MLLIDCPNCGPRAEEEFAYGGEAHISRPEAPDQLTDGDWADYLYMRTNAKGIHFERWMHAHGCRRWCKAARDTTTNAVRAVYRIGQPKPEIDR